MHAALDRRGARHAARPRAADARQLLGVRPAGVRHQARRRPHARCRRRARAELARRACFERDGGAAGAELAPRASRPSGAALRRARSTCATSARRSSCRCGCRANVAHGRVEAAFHARLRARYGARDADPVEIVNARLTAYGARREAGAAALDGRGRARRRAAQDRGAPWSSTARPARCPCTTASGCRADARFDGPGRSSRSSARPRRAAGLARPASTRAATSCSSEGP